MNVKRAFILALVVFALAAVGVLAAAPNVRTVSGALVPVVDGNMGEWTITPTNSTNLDWFSGMYEAGKTDQPRLGDLFLRYDCTHQVLYILVHVTPGASIDTGGDQFLKVNPPGGSIIVDKNSGNNGVAPDFQYVVSGTTTVGWEASAPLAPGSYTIWFHAQTFDSGHASQTSASVGNNSGVTVDLACSVTAVTLSSMSAQSIDNGMDWALPGLGALGIVTLGGVLFVIARKR